MKHNDSESENSYTGRGITVFGIAALHFMIRHTVLFHFLLVLVCYMTLLQLRAQISGSYYIPLAVLHGSTAGPAHVRHTELRPQHRVYYPPSPSLTSFSSNLKKVMQVMFNTSGTLPIPDPNQIFIPSRTSRFLSHHHLICPPPHSRFGCTASRRNNPTYSISSHVCGAIGRETYEESTQTGQGDHVVCPFGHLT